MRKRTAFPNRRCCCAVLAAAAVGWARAETPDLPAMTTPAAPPVAIRDSVTWQRPDLELRYEL